jgi:hypothetical protein
LSLTVPNLDDRSYADLLAEARALIPALAPDWTDHNLADPGITLVELFAWLTEMLLYRLNQVTDQNRLAFLRLISGPEWQQGDKSVAEAVRHTVLELRKPGRAVTADDFERLALAADPRVARAHCLPRTRNERANVMPADVSVVILPKPDDVLALLFAAVPFLLAVPLLPAVREALEPARLLTTRLHVVAARRVAIAVTLTIHGRSDAVEERLLEQAEEALKTFLDPHAGGPDGRGWPFGRAVYVSEVYDRLARLPQVDYVTATAGKPVLAAVPVERLRNNPAGELEAVALDPDELPAAEIPAGGITVTVPRPG